MKCSGHRRESTCVNEHLTKSIELLGYNPLSFEEGLDALTKELATLN